MIVDLFVYKPKEADAYRGGRVGHQPRGKEADYRGGRGRGGHQPRGKDAGYRGGRGRGEANPYRVRPGLDWMDADDVLYSLR